MATRAQNSRTIRAAGLKTQTEAPFLIGTKVLLHSYGAGQWFPIESHTVARVARNGAVYINDLENVGFKQDGHEFEPGAFRFRFYIEVPTNKSKPKRSPSKKLPKARKNLKKRAAAANNSKPAKPAKCVKKRGKKNVSKKTSSPKATRPPSRSARRSRKCQ